MQKKYNPFILTQCKPVQKSRKMDFKWREIVHNIWLFGKICGKIVRDDVRAVLSHTKKTENH